MRKLKGIVGSDVGVMELITQTHIGMRITRARARTLAMEEKMKKKNKNKRKFIDSRELQSCSRNNLRRRVVRRRRTPETLLLNSGEEEDIPITNSRCSSNGSSELVNENLMKRSIIDLDQEEKKKSVSTTTSTCRTRRGRRRKEIEIEIEITPSSSFKEESTRNNQESMERPSVSCHHHHDHDVDDERSEKISPTVAEIDEFFSTPEKEEQRRFANKYNYDIAKDVPLNGRYEWSRFKP